MRSRYWMIHVCMFLDIQEFYEITLLDDTKTNQQKIQETLQIASKWERQPPFTNSFPTSEVSVSH